MPRIISRVGFAGVGMLAVAGLIELGVLRPPSLRAQSAAGAAPKFEVAAIRPDANCVGPSVSGSSGTLNVGCMTVMDLIRRAYAMYPNGHLNPAFLSVPIEGGPSWINSSHFEISAKTANQVSPEMMNGPMLQALLEDRFKLKMRRETREVPVYELTVAKGGLKMQRVPDGSCTPAGTPATPEKKLCNQGSMGRGGPNGGLQDINLSATSLDELHGVLSRFVDRPIVDKTGIAGRFTLHLEFARDLTTSAESTAPSVFTAVQDQLGLKLTPAKGPGEFLVIDSVERPSEN